MHKMDTIKSKIKIGNISIDCTQHFSRQQKEHWKEYFGIIIEDAPNTNILFSATVKVHWLNVRSGAGTNYGKVSVLKYNDEVKIIQTKLICLNKWETPHLWGQIAEEDKKTLCQDEWICLDYCNLIDNL